MASSPLGYLVEHANTTQGPETQLQQCLGKSPLTHV